MVVTDPHYNIILHIFGFWLSMFNVVVWSHWTLCSSIGLWLNWIGKALDCIIWYIIIMKSYDVIGWLVRSEFPWHSQFPCLYFQFTNFYSPIRSCGDNCIQFQPFNLATFLGDPSFVRACDCHTDTQRATATWTETVVSEHYFVVWG